MRLLLGNDDGVDSPALVPFARALARLGDVAVSVPDQERSWIGKAITRTDELTVAEVERGGMTMFASSGYPADAVQLGVHLLAPRPDVVVSGINLGFNHGAGFVMSSGTVGAAVEGWISGLPAVAFSTGVWSQDWAGWRRFVESADARPGWEALAETCTDILADLLAAGLTAAADVISVNLPFDATPDTERRVTAIARTGYDQLFQQVAPGRYRHEFSRLLEFEGLHGTDVAAAHDGVVSITPVRLPSAAAIEPDLRSRVERAGRASDDG